MNIDLDPNLVEIVEDRIQKLKLADSNCDIYEAIVRTMSRYKEESDALLIRPAELEGRSAIYEDNHSSRSALQMWVKKPKHDANSPPEVNSDELQVQKKGSGVHKAEPSKEIEDEWVDSGTSPHLNHGWARSQHDRDCNAMHALGAKH